MAKLEIDINKLSRDERLDLIEQIWDSLSSNADNLPLTEEQAEELDRRVNDMEQDSSPGIPWETVLSTLRNRK